MERTVTTTDKKVLEAAANCSESKRTLEVLFPDVFKKPIELFIGGIYKLSNNCTYILTCVSGYVLVNVRTGGHLSANQHSTREAAFGSMLDTADYLGQAADVLRTVTHGGGTCRL